MASKQADPNTSERSEETKIEIRRERRFQGAHERLQARNPKCAFCTENNPLVLEKHHVAGKDYHEGTVIVCRNHHRLLSDLQKDHPQKIYEQPGDLEQIAHYLAGLADFFELLVRTLREFVKTLSEKADDNSENTPDAP
jgi:hypothetical protein